MKQFSFTTISGGDWAEHMAGRIDDSEDPNDGGPLTDIDSGEIQVQVQERGGSVLLNLTTADGSITRPASGEFQWVVATSRMSSLCPGNQYYVGCRHINDTGGTTVLWTGTLAYINGGYEWR